MLFWYRTKTLLIWYTFIWNSRSCRRVPKERKFNFHDENTLQFLRLAAKPVQVYLDNTHLLYLLDEQTIFSYLGIINKICVCGPILTNFAQTFIFENQSHQTVSDINCTILIFLVCFIQYTYTLNSRLAVIRLTMLWLNRNGFRK